MASISTTGLLLKSLTSASQKACMLRCIGPQITEKSAEQTWRFSGPCVLKTLDENNEVGFERSLDRRKLLLSSAGLVAGAFLNSSTDGSALSAEYADMPALRGKDYGKTKMRYPDYTETESGLQYKDLRLGNGPKPKTGETVVVDWDGYTIGYYGRIFEARNKTKGGSFEGDDKDFFKFRIGSQEVIPAFEEAISGMALGGIRSDAGL